MNFKDLRLKNGYSQTQLGLKIGTSFKRISQWEKGFCKPNLDYQIKLAIAFAVPLVQLQETLGYPSTPHIKIDVKALK